MKLLYRSRAPCLQTYITLTPSVLVLFKVLYPHNIPFSAIQTFSTPFTKLNNMTSYYLSLFRAIVQCLA